MANSPSTVAATANDLFDQFMSASTLKGVVTNFRRICHILDLQPGPFNEFFPAFKKGLAGTHKQTKNWKAQSVFSKIDRKASNRIYHKPQQNGSSSGNGSSMAPISRSGQAAGQAHTSHGHHSNFQTQSSQNGYSNNILEDHNCLIIGGGPCGLRTAIELQLLGAAHVLVIEKRDRFSRNNVLHLWPFVIADLKEMAGKKFYGRFCAGSIDHVSIRQLQLMLLKFALILGVDFMENITFDGICPKNLVANPNAHRQQDLKTSMNGNQKDLGESNGAKSGCNGKRKARFASDLSTNKEEEESLLSSSSDQLDGNMCGRGTFFDPTDKAAVSATRSASSSSTSSLSTSCNSRSAGNSCENSCGRESSGTESENENLTDKDDNRHLQYAVSRDSHPVHNSRHGRDGCNAPEATHPSNGCDHYHPHESCSCCCHKHSAGQSYWCPDPDDMSGYQSTGAFAHFSVTSAHPATASAFTDHESMLLRLHGFQFDVVLGADGRRNTLADHFPRKEFRGRLAIAITANFVNTHTLTEAQIPEISGISFIYNQQLFRNLYEETGIDLENICYYKDDTHYFVMTAKKSSLLARNVLYNDYADTRALLDPENINRTELLNYAKDAAKWTTGLQQSFAMNHYGEPDVAMFDFTSMYAAENACRAKKIVTWSCCQSCDHQQSKKRKSERRAADRGSQEVEMRESLLLVGLVGDSLLEPFWPTGSGCGRGFLSAMDSAWMVRQWAVKDCNVDQEAALSVLKEREAIYRLLGQTKSENLSQNYAAYTLNPISRYPNLNSSTVYPHECRHLLYDDVHPPAAPESARMKRQSIAAKRARRATIASSSPFTSVSEETTSSSLLRESEATPTRVKENISSIDQSLEDTLADFEHNYKGLVDSPSRPSSFNADTLSGASLTSSSTLINSGGNMSRSSAFNELMLSPSASNLATLGRSRAKDIEAALRHRRQQQLVFNRKDTSSRSLSSTLNDAPCQPSSQSNGASQQLKSKMSWLLDHKDATSAPSVLRESDITKEPAAPFASRVRNLEAKFQANSGLHSIDVSAFDQNDQKKKIMSKGSNVMTAATTLEQLLNPMQQEVRLKEKACDYRKKTHDIKVVMKMTKETDWNKKCWEEREKQAAAEKQNKPAVSPTPRPKQMIDIFKGKKDEITNKLHDGDSNQQQIRLTSTKKPKARKNDDNGWISLIKTELTERSTSPNRQSNKTVAKPPLRSPFLHNEKNDDKKTNFQFIHNQRKKSDDVRDSFPVRQQQEPTRTAGASVAASASPRCVRCNQQVATVDRIVISGTLLHRACLTCSKCGITLRLSEVRGGGGSAGDDVCSFNYLCILCSKNRVNTVNKHQPSDRMSTSLDGSLLVTRPPPAPISPNQQRRQAAAEKTAAASFAATDEYELRLRERMKWKEQFLLNNNNIDFGPLVKRQVFKTSSAGLSESNHSIEECTSGSNFDDPSKAFLDTGAAGAGVLGETKADITSDVPDSGKGDQAAGPSSRRKQKINERIEYENVSNSFELYDDDELTKMLNLESGEQWESGEEEETTSSGSWRRSEDSTDADFDSDEFDLSNASKHAERKRQEASKRKQEQEALVVPEIVVQETDEDGGATSEEIDTNVLDTAGGFSLHLHESTLDQISESDSLDAQNVDSGGVLASSASSKKENSARNCYSNSDSDSGESHTLADASGKIGLLASLSHSRSMDSQPISKDEDDEDTVNTSVSSLSCCDVSGTFEDLNLLSLLDEETEAGSASVDAPQRKGLDRGSTASSFLTSNLITSVASMLTGDVTASAPAACRLTPTSNNSSRSNRTNAESSAACSTASYSTTLMQSHNPSYNPTSSGPKLVYSSSKDLLLGESSSAASTCSNINSLSSKSTTISNINTGSTSGNMRVTNFKVAQPKFTVFNLDFQLPSVSTSGTGSCLTSSVKSPSAHITCSRKPDATVTENVIKSDLSFVPSRSSGTSGGMSSGPPTHQDHETYSKIPVLATRVNECNQSPKGKPSYSGSFTEKLMLRCRSSPTLVGKENLKSADGSGTAAAGPAYQSVLAKWACNNLFQMEKSSSPATYSVMDLLSRSRSNDTGSRNGSIQSDHTDTQ